MTSDLLRAAVALLLAGLLAWQARAAAGPNRRRAFGAAAGGLLAFGGYSAYAATGAPPGVVQWLLLGVGALLLLVAAYLLVLALIAGEFRRGRAAFDAEMRAWRDRRERHEE